LELLKKMRGDRAELPARSSSPEILAVAVALMKLTRTVHPPACSNPLLVCALHQAPWSFLLFPTLTGAGLIILAALFYHNLRRAARWPKYWF